MVYDKVLWLFFFATVVIALQPLFHVAHRGLHKKLEMLLGCAVLCVACTAFQMLWGVFSSDFHILDPKGIGWIYRVVEAGSTLTILLMAVAVPHLDIRLGHEVEK